jgi:hypothetical protein
MITGQTPTVYPVNSATHRAWEEAFYAAVDGASDPFRARLAMRAALQNASDTSPADMGFWACAFCTYAMAYDCAAHYFPEHYGMAWKAGRRVCIRIRKPRAA